MNLQWFLTIGLNDKQQHSQDNGLEISEVQVEKPGAFIGESRALKGNI